MASEQVTGQPRYVKWRSAKALDLSYFPHFMIVGPQRTGTSWMVWNLRTHPHIFLSDPKEIHFFNCLKNPAHPKYRSNDLGWYLRFFHDTPLSYTRKMYHCLLRYGEPYRPRIRGEATASYAALGKDVIGDIVSLRPDIKIILMIRNPVERAWSHAKKDLPKRMRRPLSEIPAQEFERFFSDDYQLACGRYTRMIRNWTEMLRDGNLFIGRFDDIRTRPEDLLCRICTFLGVDDNPRYMTWLAQDRINSTSPDRLPERYRQLLREMFADELDFLRSNFGMSWD